MKRISSIFAIGLPIAAFALAVWAFWLEPRRLTVKRETLSLPGWTLKSELRIAVLADLHVGSPFNGVKKLERAVAATNALKPDVVVLLGDYVIQGVIGGRFVPPERIAAILSNLKAPHGTYAVLGNHDWWLDARRVKNAFSERGLKVVDDSAQPLVHRSEGFWLGGVSDFLEGKHDVRAALAHVTDGQPVVLITHNPDVFPQIPERVTLTIAGHTHGGQVDLPLVGRPVVPSKFGERYASGHVVENGKNLFVSSGIGTSILPVRFRVPPEIVLLTIQAQRRAG